MTPRTLYQRPRVYERRPDGLLQVRVFGTDFEAWLHYYTRPRGERVGWRAAGDPRPARLVDKGVRP
jgi:hypothetical protein